MKTIQSIQRYIEEEPWDEWIIKNDKYLERACIAIIIAGALYFGIGAIVGFMG